MRAGQRKLPEFVFRDSASVNSDPLLQKQRNGKRVPRERAQGI